MMQLPDLLYGAALAAYGLALAYVTVYCLLQLHLLGAYLRQHRGPAGGAQPTPEAPLRDDPKARCPRVTVQLPLYNERYVATRVIDAVCAFDYPRDRLEVQVLDDSDDDTVGIVAERVAAWRARGVEIVHVRRARRHGFKAGALADGLTTATGEFVAVFDADFVPAPDFLARSLPHFGDAGVGVVQSRWGHLNEDYSLITQLQALQLNVHFTVEQVGRRAAGLFAQFNGTAGVWRRACIDHAGGWRATTLTEDLDLSMRAQLRGWQITYLEDSLAPAELPVEMAAFRSQQHRWMKGGAECARLLLPQVWHSERLTWGQKFHTTAHLLASSIFVFVCAIGLLSVPAMAAVVHFGIPPAGFTIFLAATLAVAGVYYVGNVRASWHALDHTQAFARFVVLFPLFLSLSMGLSLHNAAAVLEGLRGRRSAFVRTPKFNVGVAGAAVATNVYRGRGLSWLTVGEGALALLFAGAAGWGLWSGHNFFVLFHLMLAVGYGSICGLTLVHRGRRVPDDAAWVTDPLAAPMPAERSPVREDVSLAGCGA